ncbi:hypothetical protein O181_111918 [Austropuccinia psidii MF-1]|uniref:Uncharacterized protein n=1 Tax=Austropuccinia psidii MF-1 TaxID=1389203 RepID=A0A9Q3K0D9_9BASI|nr:hypothetical protein [Austropuccinia psidii MF-1]
MLTLMLELASALHADHAYTYAKISFSTTASPSLPYTILTLSHPAAYHAYAPTLTSHSLNLPSLFSCNDWLPQRRPFIGSISHHYANEKIGFLNTGSSSPLYTILMHLHPHILSCLCSHTSLSPPWFTILRNMK